MSEDVGAYRKANLSYAVIRRVKAKLALLDDINRNRRKYYDRIAEIRHARSG